MKRYQGTKIVHAAPAYRILGMIICCDTTTYETLKTEYNINDIEIGYKVIYSDGYQSWSPKDIFDEAYRICETQIDELVIRYESLTNEIQSITEMIRHQQTDIEMCDYLNSLKTTRIHLHTLISKLKTE